jgi:hypothetical protein
MDSLYKGYPVGYIITWRNPDTKLKDGTTANRSISSYYRLHRSTLQNTHAWILTNPQLFAEPVPYKHPQGAVIWVNLPER